MKENCVLCSKPTAYKVSDNINKRDYYVEGCGQLCKECFERVYIKETTNNAKKAHFLLD